MYCNKLLLLQLDSKLMRLYSQAYLISLSLRSKAARCNCQTVFYRVMFECYNQDLYPYLRKMPSYIPAPGNEFFFYCESSKGLTAITAQGDS